MKEKKQPIITYRKNGLEKTIKLNFWNHKKVLSEIFKISNYSFNKTMFTATIKSDIDFVHFKNLNFTNYAIFKCQDDDLVCLFENCTFEFQTSSLIYFIIPKVKLIDINFKNVEGVATILCKEIYLKTENSSKLPYGLNLNSQNNIHLEGSLNLSKLALKAPEITIGNPHFATNIILKEFDYTYPEIDIKTETLTLNKSIINCISENSTKQNLIFSRITIDDDSKIISNQTINLNHNSLINPAKKEITITKDNLKHLIANSIIKSYHKLISTQIERKKQQILATKFKDLKEEISENEQKLEKLKQELETQIRDQEKIITTLKEELETKNQVMGAQITRSLKKKPLKYFEFKS